MAPGRTRMPVSSPGSMMSSARAIQSSSPQVTVTLVVRAEEHARLDKAGQLRILRGDQLHVRRLDLHEHGSLLAKPSPKGAGKIVPAEGDQAVLRVGHRGEDVHRARFLHHVERVRREREPHLVAHGHIVRRVHDPFIAAAVHVHLVVHAHDTTDCTTPRSRAWSGGTMSDVLRAHDHVHLHVAAKARVHALVGRAAICTR